MSDAEPRKAAHPLSPSRTNRISFTPASRKPSRRRPHRGLPGTEFASATAVPAVTRKNEPPSTGRAMRPIETPKSAASLRPSVFSTSACAWSVG